MGAAIQGAGVGFQRDTFGKKLNGKPRRMVLPEGVRLLPVEGKFELQVGNAPVGRFDTPSAAIDHLVRTGRIVPEKVKDRPRSEQVIEYMPGPDGGTNLYLDGEFEGYFPALADAKSYVRELAGERRRESLRRKGNYWD